MVSTQDSESCDPSSNLGGTFLYAARDRVGRLDGRDALLYLHPVRHIASTAGASIAQWLEHQSSTVALDNWGSRVRFSLEA